MDAGDAALRKHTAETQYPDPHTMRTFDDHHAHSTGYEHDYLAWYTRENDTVGTPFDAALLAQLAREQWSDRPALALACARCTAQWKRNELYSYFIAPMHRRARWNFGGSLFLDHPTWGTLAVDVLMDPNGPGGFAIGGIEFLERVLGRPTSAREMNEVRLHMAALHVARRNTN